MYAISNHLAGQAVCDRPIDFRHQAIVRDCVWGDGEAVSTGHGDVPWEDAFRALTAIGYDGPISIEWEDAGMDRLEGAAQAVNFVRSLLFTPPAASFDAAFSNQ